MNGNAKKNPIFAARAVVRLFSVPVSVWILFIFFFASTAEQMVALDYQNVTLSIL